MFHRSRLSIAMVVAIALIALGAFEATGGGAVERSVRAVGRFDSVSFGMEGELIIAQGDREALEIVARPGDLPSIVTEVRDGTLYIGREGRKPPFGMRSPVFRLTIAKITALETHGSGSISAESLRTDSLCIKISSSGGVAIGSLAADSLEAQLCSSGSLRMGGKVNVQNILLSSSGSYLAGALACTTAQVRVSSSGSATLRVSDSLVAQVTSSGNVRYYGNPPKVEGRVTSSGRLVRLGG